MYSIYNDDTLHIFVAFYVVDLIVSMWLFLLVAPLWLVYIDCEIGRAWGLTSDSLDYIYTWTVIANVVENTEINPLNRNICFFFFHACWNSLHHFSAEMFIYWYLLCFGLDTYPLQRVIMGTANESWIILLQRADLLYRRTRRFFFCCFVCFFSL